MTDRPWQTGRPRRRQPPVPRPTAADLLRQLGLMALIAASWVGTLAVFLSVFAPAATSAAAARVSPADQPAPVPATIAAPASAPVGAPTLTPAHTATAAPTGTPTGTPTIPPVVDGRVSYAAQVQPLFDRLCVKCHGGEKTEEGLVLKSYAEVLAGSDNGPVVVPGDTVNSLLVDLVTQGKMPKRGPRLLPAELRLITDWVAQGAQNN